MKSLQNSVLTAMTDTGFTYGVVVKMPDEVPVGRNSLLFKCHYGLGVILNLVCEGLS